MLYMCSSFSYQYISFQVFGKAQFARLITRLSYYADKGDILVPQRCHVLLAGRVHGRLHPVVRVDGQVGMWWPVATSCGVVGAHSVIKTTITVSMENMKGGMTHMRECEL